MTDIIKLLDQLVGQISDEEIKEKPKMDIPYSKNFTQAQVHGRFADYEIVPSNDQKTYEAKLYLTDISRQLEKDFSPKGTISYTLKNLEILRENTAKWGQKSDLSLIDCAIASLKEKIDGPSP